jgi:ABC-type xylose transport system substrate-binding protein
MMGADKKLIFFTDTFEYNSDNRLIKMTRLLPNATIYFYKTYQNDSIGNLSSEVIFEKKQGHV